MDFTFKNEGNQLPNQTNEASQSISNTYDTSRRVAILYIFSPRSIVDTCKRPIKYNFDAQFIEDVKANSQDVYNNTPSGIGDASYMNNFNSSLYAVGVDAQGSMMNNKHFEDYYTFLLQIDNEQLAHDNFYQGPMSNNRFIYSGFCNNEPYSSNDGLRVVINPNCVLSITHSTSMMIKKRYSPNGEYTRMNVNKDVDYLLPDVTQLLNTNLDYVLTPDHIQRSLAKSENYSFYLDETTSLAAYGSKPLPVYSYLNSPKHHLFNIVSAINNSMEDINAGTVSNGQLSKLAAPVYGDTDVFRSAFNANIQNVVSDNMISLDGSRVYSIADLQMKYPGLQIVPINANKLSQNDLAFQGGYSRANVASSILVTSIPALAADAGLCEIGMFYKSYSPNLFTNIVNGRDADQLQVTNVAPYAKEDISLTKLRVTAFINMMREQVFPIIKNIGGDFDLSMSCNSAGECDVLLYFMDDKNGTTGIYESPLLLGGLNSPLVGSRDIYENNGLNLGAVLLGMSGVASEIPGRPFNVQYPGIKVLEDKIEPNEEVVNNIFSSGNF